MRRITEAVAKVTGAAVLKDSDLREARAPRQFWREMLGPVGEARSIEEAIASSVTDAQSVEFFRAPAAGAVLRRAFAPEIRSIDEAQRTITFVASTEATDRYGDIIRVAGWKLENYKKNPVFLFAHQSSQPPIGKTVSIWTETTPKPALVHKVEFADPETYAFADTIYRLYKGGFLRSVSVGFMPTERPAPILDADGHMTGLEFVGQELLELSAVPIPANPEAVGRCGISGCDARRIFLPANTESEIAALDGLLADLVEE